jgi:hypothetical protein
MPKRSSKKREDENQTAARVVGSIIAKHDEPAPPAKKNPAAVALGRLGGMKGGKARAAKLTPEKRAEIARRAAAKRWEKADS